LVFFPVAPPGKFSADHGHDLPILDHGRRKDGALPLSATPPTLNHKALSIFVQGDNNAPIDYEIAITYQKRFVRKLRDENSRGFQREKSAVEEEVNGLNCNYLEKRDIIFVKLTAPKLECGWSCQLRKFDLHLISNILFFNYF